MHSRKLTCPLKRSHLKKKGSIFETIERHISRTQKVQHWLVEEQFFENQTISKRSIAGDLFGLWAFLRNGCLLRMCLKEAQLPKPLTTIGWWMLTLINPILVAGSYHDTGFLPYAFYCYILLPFRLRWQQHILVGVPSPRNHAAHLLTRHCDQRHLYYINDDFVCWIDSQNWKEDVCQKNHTRKKKSIQYPS